MTTCSRSLLIITTIIVGVLVVSVRFVNAVFDDQLLVLPLKRVDHTKQIRNLQTTTIYDELYQGLGTHYVDIYVGCPPQKQTVIVDTGSDVTGFPCSECDLDTCGDSYHLNPFYEEDQSACFVVVPCEECFIGRYCDVGITTTSELACSVGISYAEGSSWYGYEVQDTVSLDQVGDVRFNLKFACQTRLTGLFRTQLADGIMGMSKGSASFWRQMLDERVVTSSQFSLCFLLKENPESYAGYMSFGRPNIQQHITPLVYALDVSPTDENFYLAVKQIYLRSGNAGYSIIPIENNSTYISTSIDLTSTQNMLIDSGTTNTYLNRDLKFPFQRVWETMTSYAAFSSYLLITEEELTLLPTIIFQIQGIDNNNNNPQQQNQNLAGTSLDPNNPNDVLVAFPPTNYLEKDTISGRYYWRIYFDEYGSGVLGANFHTGHDVVHDPDNNRIGFAESRCDINATTSQTIPTIAPSTTISDVPEPTISPMATPTTSVEFTEEPTLPTSESSDNTAQPSFSLISTVKPTQIRTTTIPSSQATQIPTSVSMSTPTVGPTSNSTDTTTQPSSSLVSTVQPTQTRITMMPSSQATQMPTTVSMSSSPFGLYSTLVLCTTILFSSFSVFF